MKRSLLPTVVTVSMIACLEWLSGCASAPPPPQIPYTGDPVVDGNAHLAVAPPNDRVLWDYRIAAAAMHQGNYAEAKAKLDDAILNIGGIVANDVSAAKARGYFHSEDTKKFIGEPYERIMAYYYRAILYWMDGEPDNARACFRTGQLIDSDAATQEYQSDYVLLDYLDGLATTKEDGDGSDAFQRAEKLSKTRRLPPYNKSANVICFVEFGHGPTKWAAGEHGELLKFRTTPSRVHSAALSVDGRTIRLPAYDDLNFQAVTRGGRAMDHILGNKAVFKDSTNAIGDVSLVGAALAAQNNSHDSNQAAIGLAAIALISKVASAATTARADVRSWDNLPQYLSFSSFRLAPGIHDGTLEFFDAQGQSIPELSRQVELKVADGPADTVVFLSELKK